MENKKDKKVENMINLIRYLRKHNTLLKDTVLVIKDGKIKFEKIADLN